MHIPRTMQRTCVYVIHTSAGYCALAHKHIYAYTVHGIRTNCYT